MTNQPDRFIWILVLSALFCLAWLAFEAILFLIIIPIDTTRLILRRITRAMWHRRKYRRTEINGCAVVKRIE